MLYLAVQLHCLIQNGLELFIRNAAGAERLGNHA